MQTHGRTSNKQKIALIIFGLFLCIILLETGLRIGGFILLSQQEYRNRDLINQKGNYRIMCLGESTTARKTSSWPRQLEKILNQRNSGTTFKVINKAIVGTNSTRIVRQLEKNINKYNPDMIIVMMGINDTEKTAAFEDIHSNKAALFLKSFRIYKLVKFLRIHIMHKFEEKKLVEAEETLKNALEINLKNDFADIELAHNYRKQGKLFETKKSLNEALEMNPKNDAAYIELAHNYRKQEKLAEAEIMFKKALEMNPKNDATYIELAHNYRKQDNPFEAEIMFKKAVEMNPKNDSAYIELAHHYWHQGKLIETEIMFKKAVEMHPKKDAPYIELAYFYRIQDKLVESEKTLKEALEVNPKNDTAYVELAQYNWQQGKSVEAEIMFKKALEVNPKNDTAYIEFAHYYQKQEKLVKAEVMYKKALEINPKNDIAYVALGNHYWQQKKLVKAEVMYKKALEINPKNDAAYAALAHYYLQQEKLVEADIMFKKASEIIPKNDDINYQLQAFLIQRKKKRTTADGYSLKISEIYASWYEPVTIRNFQILKKIAIKNGVKLVFMQYPVRSIKPLVKIFRDKVGLTFVDNEKIFKKAIARDNYDKYFLDKFGGNFGHTTVNGDKLLAENAANVILKEFFKKK